MRTLLRKELPVSRTVVFAARRSPLVRDSLLGERQTATLLPFVKLRVLPTPVAKQPLHLGAPAKDLRSFPILEKTPLPNLPRPSA